MNEFVDTGDKHQKTKRKRKPTWQVIEEEKEQTSLSKWSEARK